jgi:hypothetical protein
MSSDKSIHSRKYISKNHFYYLLLNPDLSRFITDAPIILPCTTRKTFRQEHNDTENRSSAEQDHDFYMSRQKSVYSIENISKLHNKPPY